MRKNKTELILALDVRNLESAKGLLSRLKNIVRYYKIGSSLFTRQGPGALDLVRSYGGKVFLDLKYHDIPNTVKNAVANANEIGAYAVSLHISGGTEMIEACARLRRRPLLWGVGILTSLDSGQLKKIGFGKGVKETVLNLAKIGLRAGLDGLVCSGKELDILRRRKLPIKTKLIVPGIQTKKKKTDQKRVIGPGGAKELGADFIVVGRAVLESSDPVKTVEDILRDIND